MSVRPRETARLTAEQIFMKFDIWVFFLEIEVSLKYDKKNGYFTWRPV